jgi:protein-L-isoaspartate(D-aspartate) O-methyltransferase
MGDFFMKYLTFWFNFSSCLMILAAITINCAEKLGSDESYEEQRQKMVKQQIVARGVKDNRVLEAIRQVPRHLFVPVEQEYLAYEDHPLPIGHGQTISQPYIVALMTELAKVQETDVVLEIGTGSGYQAAVLSLLARKVYTIEYVQSLGLDAKERLQSLKYENVEVKIGDGYQGWPEHQPFDAIIVTAAIDHIPQPLLDQLKPGGRLVIPLEADTELQNLLVVEKSNQGKISQRQVIPVRFVPFLGTRGKTP